MHNVMYITLPGCFTMFVCVCVCVCTLIAGGQAVSEHRQVVGEDSDQGPRDSQRGPVLRGGRDDGPAPSPPPRAAGALPEVTHRLPGEEEAGVPEVLLCV